MALNIRTKIAATGAATSILLVVILVVVAAVAGRGYGGEVAGIVEEQTTAEITAAARGVASLVEAQSEAVALKVSNDLNVARDHAEQEGGFFLSPDQTWAWTAVNQFTKEETELSIPQLLVGSEAIPQTTTFDTPLPVVDDTFDLVGGTTTIFQRMNEEGDMLRVATTVRKLDDTRAVGTYIPATNSDGTPNTVVNTVLSGETYRGIAYVVNAWYVTAYEPIFDDAGEVIGILYQGEKQQNLDIVRHSITETVIGENGYVAVLGGQGDDAGQYIISRDGAFDGEFVTEAADVDGNPVFADLLTNAVDLEPGEIMTTEATWQHPGDDAPAPTLMQVQYFAAWDWVIITNAYLDDYAAPLERAETGASDLVRFLIIVGAAAVAIGIFVARFTAGRIAAPLKDLADSANTIAAGDVNVEIAHRSNDEIGTLADAFRDLVSRQQEVSSTFERLADGDLGVELEPRSDADAVANAFAVMVESLRTIVSNAQDVSAGLLEGAQALEHAARDTIQASSEVANSVSAVAARVEAQSTMSTEVAETVRAIGAEVQSSTTTTEEAVGLSADANRLAIEGRSKLDAAIAAMDTISEVMNGAQQAADALANHSHQVDEAVGFIRSIADQTNLLALNAAIEAARAGEAGRGFAVVATEVKQLAEEAGASTERIAVIVTEMRNITNRVVGSIESGHTEVTEGSEVMNDAGQSFESIGDAIRDLVERLDQVRASSVSIDGAVRSIDERVETLEAHARESEQDTMAVAATSEESAATAEEIGAVAAKLVDTGSQLTEAVSRFRL